MATTTEFVRFYPVSRFDRGFGGSEQLFDTANALEIEHLRYFGEANFEGPESPAGIVKLWCIAERRDIVADGDVIFAPCNFDAFLNLGDVDSELKSFMALLVSKKSESEISVTPIGLLGEPVARDPMDGKEAIGELFSKSVFGTNRTVTMGAGEVRKFLVLKPQMRELKGVIDIELARWLVALNKRRQAGSSVNQGPTSAGASGENNIDELERGVSHSISNNSEGGKEKGNLSVSDFDGNFYFTGKKENSVALGPVFTFRARFLTGETFRYLLKNLGFMASGEDILREIDQAMARAEYGTASAVRRQLEAFASVRDLLVFQDSSAIELFFKGEVTMNYGNLSLGFFTRASKSEQIEGTAGGWNAPMNRERLATLADQVALLIKVIAAFHGAPEDGRSCGRIVGALEGKEGYELLHCSDDYARWRAEKAFSAFVYAMSRTEKSTSGFDLSTRAGVWCLFCQLFEEAVVTFAVHEKHPHTSWGISTSGFQSITFQRKKSNNGPKIEQITNGNELDKRRKREADKKKAQESTNKKIKTEKKGDAESKDEEGGGDGMPCFYGIMSLRKIKDPRSRAVVACGYNDNGGGSKNCERCTNSEIKDIKGIPRQEEERVLKKFEEKVKGGTARVQNLAVEWRKAWGKG
jgi:hypothetical protein